MVTLLNRKPIFERHMVPLETHTHTHTSFDEIGLCAQDIYFVLGTVINATERAFVITQRGRDYSLCSLITFASQLGFGNLK